jgi:hypothetical protein
MATRARKLIKVWNASTPQQSLDYSSESTFVTHDFAKRERQRIRSRAVPPRSTARARYSASVISI